MRKQINDDVYERLTVPGNIGYLQNYNKHKIWYENIFYCKTISCIVNNEFVE